MSANLASAFTFLPPSGNDARRGLRALRSTNGGGLLGGRAGLPAWAPQCSRASPEDFGKLIADETEKWGKVIRAANIKAE